MTPLSVSKILGCDAFCDTQQEQEEEQELGILVLVDLDLDLDLDSSSWISKILFLDQGTPLLMSGRAYPKCFLYSSAAGIFLAKR